MLTLPDGATLISGNNPAIIGTMDGGTITEVTWTVVFQKNGTHTLQVRASGYDSDGNPCSVSKSAMVFIGGFSPPSTSLEGFFKILTVIGLILTVILVSVFVLRKRRQPQPISEFKKS